MTDLTLKTCIPCQGGVPKLDAEQIEALHGLISGWQVVEGHHLSKTYRFESFDEGLQFVNRLGAVAEHEGHHPDVQLSWGRVQVDIFTHKVDGLTESDFILAAKTDQVLFALPAEYQTGGDCGCGDACACQTAA